ncbi:MAG: hypothetical protein HMLKMBBP_02048 [Planctomycetes bacterium]|nr:hypothetical protein [Planctomycetota bacterium]
MRRTVTGLAACACALAGSPSSAAPDEVSAAVSALIDAIAAKDAAARKGPLAALAKARIPAVQALMDRLRDVRPSDPSFRHVVDALAAVDPAQAVADIESERSRWVAFGWREGGDDAEARRKAGEVAERMIADLRSARPAADRREAPLEPAVLADPALVPPEAERDIADHLPSEWMWGDYAVKASPSKLQIDTAGDGSFATAVAAGKPATVEAGPKTGRRRVLVHRRFDRWIAAPTSLLRGSMDGLPVEFLDAQMDGDFGSDDDLVRFGKSGAFRRIGDGNVAWSGTGFLRWKIRPKSGGAAIEWEAEPLASWTTDAQREAVAAANAWRQAAGLVPQRQDRTRSEACRLHHEYWRINGFTDHRESKEAKGYTPEGAEAGRSSSVIERGSGPASFVQWIGATILHRSSLVARADDGTGFWAGPGGQLLWGGETQPDAARGPTLVPAPGQGDVPTNLMAEAPVPARDPSFYGTTRGYPVSVTFSGLDRFVGAKKVRLELHAGDSAAPLRGELFSAETPYVPGTYYFDTQGAVFTADKPLDRGATYTARLRCETMKGPVDLSWRFRTQ